MTTTVINTSDFMPSKNTNLAKWDILFDKKRTEWLTFKPQVGLHVYPCYGCSDIFRSRNSFLDHINRRAMVLKYRCRECSKSDIMVFYNPCSFLLHTRQHYTLLHGQIHLEDLELSLLPYGLGGFLPVPNIPLLFNVEDDNVGETMFINSKFYSPLMEFKGDPVVKLIPNDLLFMFEPQSNNGTALSLILKQVSSNIPRCQFVKLDKNRLLSLSNEKDTLSNETDAEKKQPQVNQKDCNLENTIDIYSKSTTQTDTISSTNEIVPEEDDIENYTHCPECDEVQITSMGEHFLKNNKPFQESLRCGICKYIAPTKCSLKAHERIHNGVPPYVCPECGKTFEYWDLFNVHLEEVCFHLTKQVRFRCPGKKCGKIFAQSATFSAHFATHMQCLNKCTICNESFEHDVDFLDHAEIHREKLPPGRIYKCSACPEPYETPMGQSCQIHIAYHVNDRKQYLYVYICKYCHSYFRSTLTYASHILRCTKSKKNFNTNDSIEKTRNKSSSLDLRFDENCCLLCKQQLTDQELKDHFRLKECKYCEPVIALTEKLPRNIHPVKYENSRKRKRTSNPSSKSKKLSTADTMIDIKPDIEEVVPANKVYQCKLCNYGYTGRKVFHDHVIKHRDVRTAYQCMECGECFVVKPSLMKHLLYYHQISDIDTYIRENNCFDKQAVSELKEVMRLAPGESKGPVAENQCRVCLEQFDNNIELNKHFRIHGMAFLLKNYK